MSGFLGILNPDGAPVDLGVLNLMTQSIAFRGPDAQRVWSRKNVALGHTLLQTTFEARHEKQPCTLDDNVWIAADCRIDAREELVDKLVSHSRAVPRGSTDPELILHAYSVWGTDCVLHLLGDFSFALWDEGERRLFCARDQMGAKLFYYAYSASAIVVGNTQECLRLHPAVSSQLDDAAVANFLLFGFNVDLSSTYYVDIRRLLPAHTLVWQHGELRISPYWTLPIDPPLVLRRASDYVDAFWHVLNTAVKDRLRVDRAAIHMSGGLDSTAIAAACCEISGNPPSIALQARTVVFDNLIPDQERYFAGLAARHLGIPITFMPGDNGLFFEEYLSGGYLSEGYPGRERLSVPDPANVPTMGSDSAMQAWLARENRVAFYGEGADNALAYEWEPWFRQEYTAGRYMALLKTGFQFVRTFRRLPFARIPRRRSGHAPSHLQEDLFPVWLNAEFSARLDMRDRFNAGVNGSWPKVPRHPFRPKAYESLTDPTWGAFFEQFDPGFSALPMEVRHPFLDIRMLRFLLSLPPIPWCRDKFLIRAAIKNRLPREITTRRKAPLAGAPQFERWKDHSLRPPPPSGRIVGYVDLHSLSSSTNRSDITPSLLSVHLRAWQLDIFLRHMPLIR